ncbi:ATP-dependent DNA helicase PIF1, partial [Fusarium albosuccineum]
IQSRAPDAVEHCASSILIWLPGRPATKRTEGDAGLSPLNERSGTQPTSPEKPRATIVHDAVQGRLWQLVGLCNGARGTVYDIGWAPGADPIQDPPWVIMMEFDKYNGPVFLTTPDGRRIVPILPVERDFLIGATLCTRTQVPLIVYYAITVHKSQSITEDMILADLSCRDFQTGLSYVAVSRVRTLDGLMLDAPFDRNHLVYGSPPDGMKMKMRDQELRKRQVLTRSPYMI